ncbi:hypothetical protein V5O48_011456 [Marasmius crinis-equi]|uniref:Pentatricopeptide repeat-containing protein-mitochondrial domain-containing protein n=1 Tax=Marasmius crinis-equi TaxID=585013 RepID=A0ABR3F5J6_9AGAR
MLSSSSLRRIPHRIPPKCRPSARNYASFKPQESAPELGEHDPSTSSSLRARPWRTQPDTTFTRKVRGGSQLDSFNSRLGYAVSVSNPSLALVIANEMKDQNVRPNLTTYHHLLQIFADRQALREARATIDDMVLSGIEPDAKSYNLLLMANFGRASPVLFDILRTMAEKGVEPDGTTYTIMIRYFAVVRSLHMCLRYLHEMRSKGIEPELEPIRDMVVLAAEEGYPRLALDLVERYQENFVRMLGSDVWTGCLKASAKLQWKEGTLKCWEAALQSDAFELDEELCISVLDTAGRHALPDLASDVLRLLRESEIPWKERHFIPLIEAFARNTQIKEAFTTLNVMRNSGISITPVALAPLVEALKKDEESLDNAWALIETMPNVDISALNAIIGAAGVSGDLQRAVGAYKSASDLKVQPNQDTFHALLEAAVAARHPLGDLIMTDMKNASIAPNRRTYELLIDLALTQESYEDAFYFLEEMKAAEITPPESSYKAIIKRCATSGDERYTVALAEMAEMQHEVSRGFQREMDMAFRTARTQAQPQEGHEPLQDSTRHPGLDGTAQRFIETGGL